MNWFEVNYYHFFIGNTNQAEIRHYIRVVVNVGRLRGKVSTFQRSLKENRQSWRSSRGRENSSPFY